MGKRGGRGSPNPAGVAGDPALGERDELGAAHRCLSDEVDCLLDGQAEIEPAGFGLGDGDANDAWKSSCHGLKG